MNPVLPWLVLLAPAVAAVVITLTALRRPATAARWSIGAILVSFAASLVLYRAGATGETAVVWLDLPGLRVDFGLRLDALSLLMLLVVTGVGSAIHIYSWGYMRGDPGLPRYFAGLSLFSFAMLGIVLATNLLQLFVFWELVGVSSYLLIGFWYERPAAADAAKKAFLTNRVGDFGFLLGILLVWSVLGTLNLGELRTRLATTPPAWGAVATVAGLLLFCGAVGKSAQFPLHVWLPDAMEGPTPVSALIHAATMVAAGVYLLCRLFFLLNAPALEVIAWTGGLTALLAALLALQQNDIKRILAYSTLSQLGYMVMAVGLSGVGGNPSPAMYHLTTHAFFKALLFLAAGAVIHALHHEQDIWKMGGLARKLPVTYWTFLAGTLALCGAPPFSGFFSKDAILALAWERQHYALFALGVGGAALTAFYMFRLVLVAFTGPAKSQAPDHAHEAPPVMTLPLVALAVPTLLAGFWGVDRWYARQYGGEAAAPHGWAAHLLESFAHAPVAAWGGLLAAAVGFVAAWTLYRRAVSDPLPGLLGAPARWLRDRLYFDELYAALIAATQDLLARVVAAVDRWILAAGLVRGVAGAFELSGRLLRHVHTGNLQTYALLLAAGAVVLLWWTLAR